MTNQKARLLALAAEIEKIQRLVDNEVEVYEEDMRLDGRYLSQDDPDRSLSADDLDRASDRLGEARELIARFSLKVTE